MCGIVGGIGPSSPNIDILETQLKSIIHRGPDESGFYTDSLVGLAMCRLSVVEVESGKQPASDVNGMIKLVWNGEIYNYRDLRLMLQQKGRVFNSSSESEVIINLYLEFGLDFTKYLNGMFAIALYDKRDKSLHLVRDRIGEKPLWYSIQDNGTLLFASEAKALMRVMPNKTLRLDMISEVLQFGYINAPNSAFNEIKQMLPSSILTWQDGKYSIKKYWKPNFEKGFKGSYEEALEITKEKIERAVNLRLIAERPIGSFLSGGYDSTIVTAYMAKLAGTKINTFSIGFKDKNFNEAGFAQQIAHYLNTNHHIEILDPDPIVLTESISRNLDQPFADSSIIPTFLLSQFSRQFTVVALSGDGGDEIFGGYKRYLVAQLLQKVNFLLNPTRSVLSIIGLNSRKLDRQKVKLSSQIRPMRNLGERYLTIQSLNSPEQIYKILSKSISENLFSTNFLEYFENESKLSALDQLILSDLSHYLPGDILHKVDMASMANSLEVRSPFLDVNLVDWANSLPDKFKINGFETKHILKDVARSLVPPKYIDRPKMGFSIPRAEWLRSGLKQILIDSLTDSTARNRGWFNQSEVKNLIDLHLRGHNKDNALWPLLMLELWARNWLD